MLPFLLYKYADVDDRWRCNTEAIGAKAIDVQGFYELLRMCAKSVMVTPTRIELVLPG